MRNPETHMNWDKPCNRKSKWNTTSEEQEARQAAFEAQLAAWRTILPGLLERFTRIKDPRRPKSIKHKLTVLLPLWSVFVYLSTPFRARGQPGIEPPKHSRNPTVCLSRNRPRSTYGHRSPTAGEDPCRRNRKHFRSHSAQAIT